jgi:hypothetical protein
MSILFIESRSESRKGSRSTGGFWLSVALHATLATGLVSALPMGTSETVAPRRQAIPVFILPAAKVPALVASIPPPVVRPLIAVPAGVVPAEAPRVIPRTALSRDEKPAVEPPKPIAAAPLNPVAPLLGVVRGLGYGLDEAAEQAATRIRFKPAQADGRAVDYRATVHITFRMS